LEKVLRQSAEMQLCYHFANVVCAVFVVIEQLC